MNPNPGATVTLGEAAKASCTVAGTRNKNVYGAKVWQNCVMLDMPFKTAECLGALGFVVL